MPCNPDSLWRIEYGCNDCGQAGTARFSGKDMIENSLSGAIEPSKTIYCCECKSENTTPELIRCYDDGGEAELDRLFEEAVVAE